jgi:hypothetical protein
VAPQPGALVNLPDRLRSHAPLRPMWICRSCGTPWPCATARLYLKAEYCERRTELPTYMATVMHEAIADLDRLNPDELDLAAMFARFIAWTEHRLPTPPG